MYELHIATPTVPPVIHDGILASLTRLGFDNEIFYAVENIRPADADCHPAGTPPTGHDLSNPRIMSTMRVEDYHEARQLVISAMEVLARHSVKGNFEIEGLIGTNISDYPAIDVGQDFPGFKRVEDSPAFESHIIWEAVATDLPSFDKIVEFFEAELGTSPHQIVDFGRDSVCNADTVVSRVATVYQPDRKAALAFAKRLAGVKNTLGHRYSVAEQVVLVGEPTH